MTELRASAARAGDPGATGCRMSVPRETETRATGPGETETRATVSEGSVPRGTAIRAEGHRGTAAARTDRPEPGVIRVSAGREDIPRALRITGTAAAGTTAVTAALTAARVRARATGRREDSSSQEEAADRMADLRETGRTDFREAAGRALRVLQAIAAVRAQARVLGAVLTAVRATAEALEDRELDSGIINRLRALRERLRARIWR